MQDEAIIDAIERYLRGEMLPEEAAFFEHLRKTQPEIDQQVVEHTLFLKQLTQYGEISQLRTQLKEIHQDLSASGGIEKPRPAKVVVLFHKYKRVIGVAASIAGVTALGISGLISYLSPKVTNEKVELLSRRLQNQEFKLNSVTNKINSDEAAGASFKSGGTGFLIDGKGYLITNAHVVKNATLVEVQNALGEYQARIIQLDRQSDLALLKIVDSSYHPFNGLPYGISRTGAELGEDLFTLGYPRPQIVYGKGYMSAETGFEGDTLACQITIAANPGNSGTPVLNNDGEVIGIVTSSQQGAQGVVFAVRSKNIFRAIDAMKSDSTLLKTDSTLSLLHIPLNSGLKGLDRKNQIKRIKDYIFIVKSN
ncbi:MAG TPA: serine protease [Puia sp.]|jgi:S1-C subfamily serine protease